MARGLSFPYSLNYSNQNRYTFNPTNRQSTSTIKMGVIHYLSSSESFSLRELSLSDLLPSLSSKLFVVKSFRFRSRFRSMSNDSDMILLTSMSSWFSLSMFSFALTSRYSLRLRFIIFSRINMPLTKLSERPLFVAFDSFYF